MTVLLSKMHAAQVVTYYDDEISEVGYCHIPSPVLRQAVEKIYELTRHIRNINGEYKSNLSNLQSRINHLEELVAIARWNTRLELPGVGGVDNDGV